MLRLIKKVLTKYMNGPKTSCFYDAGILPLWNFGGHRSSRMW